MQDKRITSCWLQRIVKQKYDLTNYFHELRKRSQYRVSRYINNWTKSRMKKKKKNYLRRQDALYNDYKICLINLLYIISLLFLFRRFLYVYIIIIQR